jgi:hypothetical protein
MTSISHATPLLNPLTAQGWQNPASAQGSDTMAAVTANPNAMTRLAATTQAAIVTAGSRHQAALAGHSLNKQQAVLAKDLVAAMGKAGVGLAGTVEFSVGSDSTVAIAGGGADKAATTAFLKSDRRRPNFVTRVATLARDALKVSATVR